MRKIYLFLFFLLFVHSNLVAEDYCSEHYKEITRTVFYAAVDSLIKASKEGLSRPPFYFMGGNFDWQYKYFHIHPSGISPPASSYTEYKEKYDYLFWWCNQLFERMIGYAEEDEDLEERTRPRSLLERKMDFGGTCTFRRI